MTKLGKFMTVAESKDLRHGKPWFIIYDKEEFELGEVEWYPRWRGYVFVPEGGAVFSAGCLKDIEMFMKKGTAFWDEEVK